MYATPTISRAGLPPGPRLPRPIQTAQWLLGSHRMLDRCRERYGDVFTVDLAARPVSGPGAKPGDGTWVFLADPELVKQLFTMDPAVVRTGATNEFLRLLVGPRSILVLDEPEHLAQRKLLLPPFHGERLRGYRDLMIEVTLSEMERWPVGEPFALWSRMQAITLEVIIRAVFGITEPDRVAEFRDALRTMLNRMTSGPWLGAAITLAVLIGRDRVERIGHASGGLSAVDNLVHDEIRSRRNAPDLAARNDILSALIRAGMGAAELRDELITLLVAGHESTATALAWAFERLLRHPDALARARTGDEDYILAVARETLRLRPVIPFVLRNLAEPVEIGGHRLPAGTWVAPCGYLIHRRADIYPEPHRFRPERFLDNAPGSFTWLPFGGGVRRCVGANFAQLEMTQVLRTVLATADLRATSDRAEQIRRRFITLAPSRGAEVVLRSGS
jgi:cytochrome P450